MSSYEKRPPEHARLMDLLNDSLVIALENSMRYREAPELKELLVDDNQHLQDELRKTIGEEIIGADFGLKGVMDLVRQMAPLNSPMLLTGETGTGKEVVDNGIQFRKGSKTETPPFTLAYITKALGGSRFRGQAMIEPQNHRRTRMARMYALLRTVEMIFPAIPKRRVRAEWAAQPRSVQTPTIPYPGQRFFRDRYLPPGY